MTETKRENSARPLHLGCYAALRRTARVKADQLYATYSLSLLHSLSIYSYRCLVLPISWILQNNLVEELDISGSSEIFRKMSLQNYVGYIELILVQLNEEKET